MPVRTSTAQWHGTLKQGQGSMKLGSGAYEGPYSYPSRFEDGQGTNPEELLGAAHAGCFSMMLSMLLEQAGYPPTRIETLAKVFLDPVKAGGFGITHITLYTKAEVPGIDAETFNKQAMAAKDGCPVSRALAGTVINVEPTLI